MKNVNIIFFILVTILITANSLNSQTNFTDNFDNLNDWTLFGDPLPNHIESIYGKTGVFDNNGDGWYNSGAISDQTFDISNGFILESEVYVDFYNLSGCWADAEIGIADPSYQGWWGGYDPYISLGLRANGDACWVCPGITQRHLIICGGYKTSSGWENFGDCNATAIFVDKYSNSWQILKIVVDQNRMPKFYIANTLIYSGIQPIDETVLNTERPIWLGSRSSGSAGKAYHNSISLDIITDINEDFILQPSNFQLYQNYPNPFNPNTKIKYSVPQSSNVVIKVFDILGNEIETLVNEEKPEGTYEITWYSANLPSGVYFYQLKAGDYIETKKMILMK